MSKSELVEKLTARAKVYHDRAARMEAAATAAKNARTGFDEYKSSNTIALSQGDRIRFEQKTARRLDLIARLVNDRADQWYELSLSDIQELALDE